MGAAKKKVVEESGFVTKEQFSHLENAVGSLVELIKSGALNPAPAPVIESPVEKAITAAAPNNYQTNTEWEAIAKEIIGEALDHTEIEYAKGGGMKFTVVIKLDHSNAPKDYLERYKVDRRTKEVSTTGEVGVKEWCELVRTNLRRPRQVNG